MKTLQTAHYPIHIGEVLPKIEALLHKSFLTSNVYLLVDSNTLEHCLPIIDQANLELLNEAEVLEVDPGESEKNLDVSAQLWAALLESNVGRDAVIINLGGGMITDLGGFVASCYKRGITFINVPTSLLAMVDASVGSKTGIDFLGVKNAIGLFSNPEGVFIHPTFLKTLPQRELRSGFAEMLKHGLVYDVLHWKALKLINFNEDVDWNTHIGDSVKIKNTIVTADPLEKGERKKLNFGHTIGHAIESYALAEDFDLLHGEAVALGMYAEAYISFKKNFLSNEEWIEISTILMLNYAQVQMPEYQLIPILDFLKNDKKNLDNKPMFTLLSAIGESLVNQEVEEDLIQEAIEKTWEAWM